MSILKKTWVRIGLSLITITVLSFFLANLIREKSNDDAIDMISRLSDFLRITIEKSASQFVDLKEELEFTDLYLEIEKVRFKDRLKVNKNIPDNVLSWKVPFLILQPIIENSIKHGLTKHEQSDTINIDCKMNGSSLILEVSDNGPGLPEGWSLEDSSGIGLKNISERLETLYGGKHEFKIGNNGETGIKIEISIPTEGS